jgi:hypothetical protein
MATENCNGRTQRQSVFPKRPNHRKIVAVAGNNSCLLLLSAQEKPLFLLNKSKVGGGEYGGTLDLAVMLDRYCQREFAMTFCIGFGNLSAEKEVLL